MTTRSPSGTRPTKCVYVFTVEHGTEQKYKLVAKGDLRSLGTRKIKRCLEKATGLPSSAQRVFFRNEELHDEWNGDEIGLFDGAELTMRPAAQHISGDCHSNCGGIGSVVPRVAAESRATNRCLTFADEPQLVAGSRECSASPRFLTAAPAGQSNLSFAQARFRLAENEERHASELSDDAHVALVDGPRRASLSARSVAPSTDLKRGDAPLTSQHPASHGASIHHRYSTHSASDHGGRPSVSLLPGHRPSPSQSSSLSCSSQAEPRLSLLSAENDAIRRENTLLRERLLAAERRAAAGADVAGLQAQIDELQDALLEKEKETAEAVQEAEARARATETELVCELDRLREERRRLRQERSIAEDKGRSITDTLQAQVLAQRAELLEKDEVIAQLRASLAASQSVMSDPLLPSMVVRRRVNSPLSARSPCDCNLQIDAAVQAALDRLALVLDTDAHLELDANNTCRLRVDADDSESRSSAAATSEPVSLLVTLDGATQRLYMYSTLLSELPTDPAVRLRLYERLLEGALLGKDMAGAGVGVSADNGLLLMSTSVDVRRSDPAALAALARPFVSAVREWTAEARRLAV